MGRVISGLFALVLTPTVESEYVLLPTLQVCVCVCVCVCA
jgi:hypothetical protein